MAQSLTKMYVHIIFHTKNRNTPIRTGERINLYAYTGGIINKKDSQSIVINGTGDHMHILCTLSKNITVSKLIQEIKQNTSRWLKTQSSYYRAFEWQNGYGAFSVSPSIVQRTKLYIDNQEMHHQKRSFKEEYILFLEEYGIEYNEKFLWDEDR